MWHILRKCQYSVLCMSDCTCLRAELGFITERNNFKYGALTPTCLFDKANISLLSCVQQVPQINL